ncbi:HAMP domain-containing histidine kinase, partial [bacterium]|nr:HAMP domain-containing histidine kinase [bacterium]
GLLIIDNTHRILRATPKISEWFNIDGKKLMGNFASDYITLPADKNIEALSEDDIILNNDRTSNFVASSMELKLEDKKKRFIVIIKNVTDQRELENLKEDFVATLTHDLKVPIIAETNMLELFLNETFGKISDKQEIALKNMQSSNRELLDLVQIVLDTYKYKGKNIRLYRENIMLKGFIEEIIDEMRPIADKTKNHLDFILPRDIRVFADRIQLKRVIKNLISNAISYGEPNSPIEIKIGEIPKYITIKVKDYGAGISERDIGKIFNKYYSAAKKFRKIGTGLGLYLAFQIIKAHEGDLTVESKEGEFTEFCIKIPATTDSNLYYGE